MDVAAREVDPGLVEWVVVCLFECVIRLQEEVSG